MKNIFVCTFLLLIFSFSVNAQWIVKNVSDVIWHGYNDIAINQDIVLVGGTELLRSSDLGDDWQKIQIPVDGKIEKVEFFTSNQVIMTVFNEKEKLQFILSSEDAGENWNLLHTIKGDRISDLFIINDKEAYLLSYNYLYKTKDGGVTLDTVVSYNDFELSEGLITSFSFINEQNGYILVFGKKNSSRFLYFMYKTNDFGKTWSEVNQFGFSECSGDRPLMKSVNSDIAFFACNNTALKRTTDQFDSFEEVLTPKYWQTIRGLDIQKSKKGYAVGGKFGAFEEVYFWGFMAKTLNNGITWTTEQDSFGVPLSDVKFINDSVGFVIGANFSLIMKTTTGGGKIKGDYPWDKLKELRSQVKDHKNQKHLIQITPNPSPKIFNISLTDDSNIQSWALYNMMGKEIKTSREVLQKQISLDLSSYKNGVYLIKLQLKNGGIAISKLMKH